MAINKLRYYLGPLGYLQPLPPMVGGATFPDAPIHIPGGIHTSLSGRTTADRVGIPKRSWSLTWENLTEADRLLIDALIYRSANGQLRLIDPRSTNRMPADASTGGSLSLSTGAFESLASVTDAMGATVSNGWGTADTGQAWTCTGGAGAGDFSKAGGLGKHTAGTTNVNRWSTVAAPLADFDETFSVSTDKLAVGASIFVSGVGRFVDVNNAYHGRLEFTTTQQVLLTITKAVASVTTVLATAPATGLTHVINTKYSIRFKAVGSTLMVKTWLTSGAQPAAWATSVVDTTFAAANPPGVRSLLSTGVTNTPVVISFDDYSLTGSPPLAFLNASVPASLVGILAGGQSWSGFFLNNTLSVTTEKMPILAGSTYRFSVYALGAASVKLIARPFDVAGVEQTMAAGTTEVLTGSYVRYSWLWTPSAGQVSAYFGLQAQGTGTVQTTGWHVGIDRASLDPWSFGVGCPAVVLDPEVPASYWRAKFHRIKIQLREA